jgi:glutathione peroxidase
VLAFPCNQFNEQEPGTNQEILEFYRSKYGVTFPVHVKIEVNGDNATALYVFLRKQAKGLLGTTAIKWNFTKFLVDRSGKVLDRYAPPTAPTKMIGDIEKLL